MTPANYPLTIYRGTTFGPLLINCQDADGAPVDLTGYTPYAEVRRTALGPRVVNFAPTIPAPLIGQISFGLTDEQTAVLPHGAFVWDLLLEDTSGAVLGPFLSGACTVATKVSQV